jgi:cytochrome c oxidase subunit 3
MRPSPRRRVSLHRIESDLTVATDSPISDPLNRLAAGRLGMGLFLLSLGMVFAATIIAYVVVRLQLVAENDWKPEGAPGLPWLLLLSTFLLLFSSGTMHAAVLSARRGFPAARVGGWMAVTCVLALAFLVSQVIAWIDLFEANLIFDESLYAWTFYILTGLHALHVLCGLPPLVLTTRNAWRGDYGRDPVSRSGLFHCAAYWHFLDVVWVVLFLVLMWGTRG